MDVAVDRTRQHVQPTGVNLPPGRKLASDRPNPLPADRHVGDENVPCRDHQAAFDNKVVAHARSSGAWFLWWGFAAWIRATAIASVRHPAAVDEQVHAGNVARLVTGE